MEIEQWFVDQLPAIERAIAFVCRRYRLDKTEAEDFASSVKLRFIDNEYALSRRTRDSSNVSAFLLVTIRRMLLDQRVHEWGKWHSSAEATRLGEAAIELEKLIIRDSRPLDAAIPIIAAHHGLTGEQIADLARQLPSRAPRARRVDVDDVQAELMVSGDPLAGGFDKERTSRADAASRVIQDSFNALSPEDRRILRLRFFGGLTVVQIARILHLEQKSLYRRIERILGEVRRRIVSAGVRTDDFDDLVDRMPDDFASPVRMAMGRPSSMDGDAAREREATR